MNNLEIVQRLYAAFRANDREGVLQIFAPDIEWIQNEGFPGGGRYVGAEVVLDEVFTKFRIEWESWEAPVSEWLDAGETIIALGEYRGTHKRTGKSMMAAFAHVYEVRNRRIIRFRQFTDTVKIAEAVR
ncbi:MAG: nuclear transport factor 2 family protein [Verrucomicrobia bacterium]|nr:nuclear transport factor 2 family protein [Verrucomicrobiota bacterium]